MARISKRIFEQVLQKGIAYGRKYLYWRGQRCIYRSDFEDYKKHHDKADIDIVEWLPQELWIDI